MKKLSFALVIVLSVLSLVAASLGEEDSFYLDFLERGKTFICRVDGDRLRTNSPFTNEHLSTETWLHSWLRRWGEWADVDREWLKSHLLEAQYEAWSNGSLHVPVLLTSFSAECHKDDSETSSDLSMQSRRIGDDHYITFHNKTGDIEASVRLIFYLIRIDKDRFQERHFDCDWPIEDDPYRVTQYTDAPLCEYRTNGIRLTLFKTWDVFALIAHVPETGHSDVVDGMLSIAEYDPIPVSGYRQGSDVVFCSVLTSQEAEAVLQRKPVRMFLAIA